MKLKKLLVKKMNNVKRADQFIKRIRDLVDHNDGLINQTNFYDVIYGELIRQGVTLDDQQLDVSYLFTEFYDYFLTKDNINAFFDNVGKYFFRFENNYKEVINNGEQIKMYIPLDEEHLEKGVKDIFTFLSNNNISHISKVAKRIRFDDVVVRVSNPEDAEKLSEFVNNNEYIMEGLIEPNPFAFAHNNIAYASDGRESYNGIFSKYVELYFKERTKEGKLFDTGLIDFYRFVGNYYNENIVRNNEEQLKKDFEEGYDVKDLNDLKLVSHLLIKTSDPDFTYEDYLDHFKTSKKAHQVKPAGLETEEEFEQFMKHGLDVMCRRTGDMDQARKQIQLFLSTGDPHFLSRMDNLRGDAMRLGFKDRFDQMLFEKDIEFNEYWGIGKDEQNLDNKAKM